MYVFFVQLYRSLFKLQNTIQFTEHCTAYRSLCNVHITVHMYRSLYICSDHCTYVQITVHMYSVQIIVQCTVYRLLYTVQCTDHCTLYSVQIIVHCTVYRSLYTVQCTDHCTLYSVQIIVHNVQIIEQCADHYTINIQ